MTGKCCIGILTLILATASVYGVDSSSELQLEWHTYAEADGVEPGHTDFWRAMTMQLPDPLKMLDGTPIETVAQWKRQRRPELLELFEQQMFGEAPVGRPEDLRFEMVKVDPDAMKGRATEKQIEIRFSGPGGEGKMRLLLFIPNAAQEPVPVFLLICHRDPENIDPSREHISDFWPAEALIERGYAAAAFHVSDLDPDHPDGFENGVHGIFDSHPEKRPPNVWGALTAWAWGASRAMDYLETDAALDEERVAVVGHSRGGKAALWTGARDKRFALAVSNNSGANGAALARLSNGRKIAFATKKFPHWFARNYEQYGNDAEALPFDQHELIALMAPRLVYVASAAKDEWANPEAEFLGAYFASPVWELHGAPGLKGPERPAINQPQHEGPVGYHIRSGGHDLTGRDWQWFMDFADRHWQPTP